MLLTRRHLLQLLLPRAATRSRVRPLAVVVAVAACLPGSHTIALAQTVDPNLWVTNGPVSSVVHDGGTIYIGGNFTRVGPATGGG
ncbi:MAG TPA: hypothetical protein VFP10_07050, partial [Candidatus Eisenbacteria bacterium]|nr:hypothetical protein [Candidatus Eisenbacteria bacterium]